MVEAHTITIKDIDIFKDVKHIVRTHDLTRDLMQPLMNVFFIDRFRKEIKFNASSHKAQIKRDLDGFRWLHQRKDHYEIQFKTKEWIKQLEWELSLDYRGLDKTKSIRWFLYLLFMDMEKLKYPVRKQNEVFGDILSHLGQHVDDVAEKRRNILEEFKKEK